MLQSKLMVVIQRLKTIRDKIYASKISEKRYMEVVFSIKKAVPQ